MGNSFERSHHELFIFSRYRLTLFNSNKFNFPATLLIVLSHSFHLSRNVLFIKIQ
ncbi:Uncharacterized protein APZ42_002044 [Daphnia magna]|uniref:Uncharacterized protein n=1 Tax=Daphnia magna TaxID=35525 RepID=A0A164IJV3_9CRUS|nr:Uncharacterized protein APZ42_002044 [Daphnia magna]